MAMNKQQPLCGTFAPHDWRRYIDHPSTPDIEQRAVEYPVEVYELTWHPKSWLPWLWARVR